MKKIYCIGSINIDHLYCADHVVRPRESMEAAIYLRSIGGKGLNQAVAIHRVNRRFS